MCIIYTYIYILWLTLFSKRENCWPKENLIKKLGRKQREKQGEWYESRKMDSITHKHALSTDRMIHWD